MPTQWRRNLLSSSAEDALANLASCWEAAEQTAQADVGERPSISASELDERHASTQAKLRDLSGIAFELKKDLFRNLHARSVTKDQSAADLQAAAEQVLHGAVMLALRMACIARVKAGVPSRALQSDSALAIEAGRRAATEIERANDALLDPLMRAQVLEAASRLDLSDEEARRVVNARWEDP